MARPASLGSTPRTIRRPAASPSAGRRLTAARMERLKALRTPRLQPQMAAFTPLRWVQPAPHFSPSTRSEPTVKLHYPDAVATHKPSSQHHRSVTHFCAYRCCADADL